MGNKTTPPAELLRRFILYLAERHVDWPVTSRGAGQIDDSYVTGFAHGDPELTRELRLALAELDRAGVEHDAGRREAARYFSRE